MSEQTNTTRETAAHFAARVAARGFNLATLVAVEPGVGFNGAIAAKRGGVVLVELPADASVPGFPTPAAGRPGITGAIVETEPGALAFLLGELATEAAAALAAMPLGAAKEIAAAAQAVVEAKGLVAATLSAADAARAALTGDAPHGAFETYGLPDDADCAGGPLCPCGHGVHGRVRLPAYRLADAVETVETAIKAALRGLAWGRHPGGYFVTNRRADWNGGRLVTLYGPGRVKLADSRSGVTDPAKARAEAEAERAARRAAETEYHAALDAVVAHLAAGGVVTFEALMDAVYGEREVAPVLGSPFDTSASEADVAARCEAWGLYYSPGQNGGTVAVGDGEHVSARGALRRAAKLHPESFGAAYAAAMAAEAERDAAFKAAEATEREARHAAGPDRW